jgi:acetylornithine deacetylase
MQKGDVCRYIEQHSREIVEYLKKLISIPSVNDGAHYDLLNETAIQEWLAESLGGFGFLIDKWAEDAAGVRPNVVATLKGAGTGRKLILNGHCDVVPVLEPAKWDSEPFLAVEKLGRIYGRGSSDMKGGLTAAIWAAKAIKDCGIRLKGDVYISSTAGEESGEGRSLGVASMVKRGYTAPFAIVAEPTDLELHVASAGIFIFELLVRGKSVHAASRNQVMFPQHYGLACGQEVGVDALHKALPFINMFYRMEQDWNLNWRHAIVGAGGHPFPDKQGVGVFYINPSFIEGGVYRASVNPYVKITYMVSYPPSVNRQDVIDEIRRNVNALASVDSWLRENPPQLTAPVGPRKPWDPFETSEDHEGVIALKQSYKKLMKKDMVVSGLKAVCDCTWLCNEGVPAVLVGPGNMSCGVHGDNEFVPIEDVIQATRLYAEFIMDWCDSEV